MINRFIPEQGPEELEKRLRMLRKMGTKRSLSIHLSRPSQKALFIGLTILVITSIASISTLVIFSRNHKQAPQALPKSTLRQISSFKPYYLKPSFATGFALDKDSVQYKDGVLVFAMKSVTGNTLAFTEEATPSGYDVDSLRADKKFTSAYGKAFITDAALRTTGALFTQDHTWILINSPQSVGADMMQETLNALAPAN
jgi:hypothetical protein